MTFVRSVLLRWLLSLNLFGAIAFVLAFDHQGHNFDYVIVRLVFELPVTLFVAAVVILVINLLAMGVGVAIRQMKAFPGRTAVVVPAIVAAALGWAAAAPPGFGWDDPRLRIAFAIALAVPWLARMAARAKNTPIA